jgi:hypothetical protein
MTHLSPEQKKHLAKYSLLDIADVLERAAELIFVGRTLDRNNVLLDKAVLELMNEGDPRKYSSLAIALFLSAHTEYWRANFYRINDKVNAYLIAAAEARHQHLKDR